MKLTEWMSRPDTQDQKVIDEVFNHNCYGLPLRFRPSDLIIDIGAHIGCFAAACLRRGAGKVVCVEPDPENLDIFKMNLGEDCRVEVIEKAMWNPLREKVSFLTRPQATAMGFVTEQGDIEVETISLDQILKDRGRVRLLKIDCEGGEWPALWTTTLDPMQVDEIAMELHLGMPIGGFDCTLRGMYQRIHKMGYHVVMFPGECPNLNWLLHAWVE